MSDEKVGVFPEEFRGQAEVQGVQEIWNVPVPWDAGGRFLLRRDDVGPEPEEFWVV